MAESIKNFSQIQPLAATSSYADEQAGVLAEMIIRRMVRRDEGRDGALPISVDSNVILFPVSRIIRSTPETEAKSDVNLALRDRIVRAVHEAIDKSLHTRRACEK